MAIIALKAWYLEHYQPIAEVIQRPHDIRLNRSSLLKSGLRADFLNESHAIESSMWFQRYLEGDTIDFYIEGSGTYEIANVDLRSQEIYFIKKETTAWLRPQIHVSAQTAILTAQVAIATQLDQTLQSLNRRSRTPLELTFSTAQTEEPWRLNNTQLRKIRQSLLHIVDLTPLAVVGDYLLCDPQVCLELGYSLQNKHTNQILLIYQENPALNGHLPFNLPEHHQLKFLNDRDLKKTLPSVIESLLQPYHLLS